MVASDLHGVSARAMRQALIGGERDPRALARLARGVRRNKTRELEEALDGAEAFTDHHAFVLRMMLEDIDRITTQIERLTAGIEELIAAFEHQVQQLDANPRDGADCR